MRCWCSSGSLALLAGCSSGGSGRSDKPHARDASVSSAPPPPPGADGGQLPRAHPRAGHGPRRLGHDGALRAAAHRRDLQGRHDLRARRTVTCSRSTPRPCGPDWPRRARRRCRRTSAATSRPSGSSRLEAVWFGPSLQQADAGADWFRCDVVGLRKEGALIDAAAQAEGRPRRARRPDPLRHLRHRRPEREELPAGGVLGEAQLAGRRRGRPSRQHPLPRQERHCLR